MVESAAQSPTNPRADNHVNQCSNALVSGGKETASSQPTHPLEIPSKSLEERMVTVDLAELEITESPSEKPAIVIRQDSRDGNLDKSPINCIIDPNRLRSGNRCNSDPAVLSDVSSDCSDLEEIDLESEDKHNITDIAFAEDNDPQFAAQLTPTFEIDLSDDPLPSSSSSAAAQNIPRRSSDMREKLNAKPKPVRNLSLKHSGMIKSHSSPALAEVGGCFGFRGEDYYRYCAQIVAEARQREKLKDFR